MQICYALIVIMEGLEG